METHANAKAYLIQLTMRLNQSFEVSFVPNRRSGIPSSLFLTVNYLGQVYSVGFPVDLMDDFEVALTKHQGTDYFQRLEANIRFKIYLPLGRIGLLPNLRISQELINEQRNWQPKTRVNLSFDEKMTAVLIGGLRDISVQFFSIFEAYKDLNLDDLNQAKKEVDELIAFYTKNGHLNSDQVSTRSIQLLKAAGVTQIIRLEGRKSDMTIARILWAIDEEIYYIVERLRQPPFLDVRLPDFMITLKELLSTRNQTFGQTAHQSINDHMLSTLHLTSTKRYDVALSLAHEQHDYVDTVFSELKRLSPHLNIFYYRDDGQEIEMWGRNMVEHLQEIYRNLSDHVIIFVSSDYAKKRWARHEWRSVQEAILDREDQYLLPARFDATELPGLHTTLGYIDLSNKRPEAFAEIVARKIKGSSK